MLKFHEQVRAHSWGFPCQPNRPAILVLSRAPAERDAVQLKTKRLWGVIRQLMFKEIWNALDKWRNNWRGVIDGGMVRLPPPLPSAEKPIARLACC
jgi:hypothetical protein